MTTVLSVKNLCVELTNGQGLLLNDVSFEIRRGEVFALVGESGSGKSLTALSILRLLPDALQVRDGSVILSNVGGEEQDIFRLAESEMNRVRGRRISMIFQEPQTSLNPVQTVGEQLAEVFALHRGWNFAKARPDMLRLLEEVGIPDPASRLHWYPHQLSGGQKQRVMIAMALACEPELLIADEPTTALDVTIQKQILDLLKQLCERRNLSVLLITHDMGVVAEMAHRVAVMRCGALIEQDAAKDFFRAPSHEYSRELIRSLPDTRHFLPPLPADREELLAAENIKVWFPLRHGILQRIAGYTRAVDGVQFSLRCGETLALVGESGCGKTSIGKALVKLNPLHSGTLRGPAARRDIQMIFQDPYSSMNPRLTVREIIEEGMISLRVETDSAARQSAVERLIERVGLERDHLDRYPHEFSGGQRQRIAIARALAVKPKLLVCDEPTSALDVSIRRQVLELLKQLQEQEGLSYLFITHDLSLVPGIAHRVAVMKEGVIVEQGATQQVMTAPQHAYTKTLLAAAPRLPF